MNNFLIYKHTSPIGKSYIGQTNNYKKRCSSHQISKVSCRAFSNAIKKYGWDNFSHEILMEDLSVDQANYWECHYIKELNTVSPNGYNLTHGGANGIPSLETRAIWSKQRLGRATSNETKLLLSRKLKGRVFSEDTRKKISIGLRNSEKFKKAIARVTSSNIGKVVSIEVRKKISEKLKGFKQAEHTKIKRRESLSGLKRTCETKRKISDAKKGVEFTAEHKSKISQAGKKQYVITHPDGFKEVILGIQDFCRKNNLNVGNMVQVAKGNLVRHKGFCCEYFYDRS